jgi:hypothetical protein
MLAEDWMRALTIVVHSEPGTTPEQLIQSIAQANQPASVRVEISTPLPQHDIEVLEEARAWNAEVRSSQAKVNTLVDVLLIGWLAEASGQSRSEVVQRLALTVEKLLPP